MAFLLNYSDLTTGVQCSAAYVKINRVTLSKSDLSVSIEVGIYASEAARKAGLQPISTQTFLCDRYQAFFGCPQIIDPVNPTPATNLDDILISQAYLTLPTIVQAATLLAGATVL